MASIDQLRKEVKRLEALAVEIELKTRTMFGSSRLECIGSAPIHFGPKYHWIKPSDAAGKDLQREVIRKYQEWYSTAHQLVKVYAPDRVEEFTRNYARDDARAIFSGFLDALKLTSGSYDGNAAATVDGYMDMFEMQRSLLLSIPSIAEAKEMVPAKSQNPVDLVRNLCDRFQLVVRQLRESRKGHESLDIKDEYDVQYLFHALLHLHFDDIRPEEAVPTYAGSSTRIDFLLKQEQIGVETKKSRRGLDAGKLGSELIEDIGRYRAHPDCKVLICFVYDPEGLIANPRGVECDLNKSGTDDIRVQVFIRP